VEDHYEFLDRPLEHWTLPQLHAWLHECSTQAWEGSGIRRQLATLLTDPEYWEDEAKRVQDEIHRRLLIAEKIPCL
jgi:hypothetical protein